MKKVYCLPVETSDWDVFNVVDENGDVVVSSDYSGCVHFIEEYEKVGMVYYYEDVKE